MRTGSSCNVRDIHRKSEPVRISIGVKVNRCAVHTLQITTGINPSRSLDRTFGLISDCAIDNMPLIARILSR